MQTQINPALAAAMTLERAAQVGEFQPMTPQGQPTVAAQLMQRAMPPSVPQIAQQAGLGAQIQAMQQQQAQQALMQQAMANRPPAGIEALNPQMGNFADGGIVGRIPGYAVAGVAEDEQKRLAQIRSEYEQEVGKFTDDVPYVPGGTTKKISTEEGSESEDAETPLPEAGLAGLATSSAPAIKAMRDVAAARAKLPVTADPRQAMQKGLELRQVSNEFAQATGNNPNMIADQITEMENLFRRRDEMLSKRMGEYQTERETGALPQFLMNFRQMKGQPIGEGFVSGTRGMQQFTEGMSSRIREIEDLRMQAESLKMEKVNALRSQKYNSDMGFFDKAMQDQQKIIENDRALNATQMRLAEEVAKLHSQEARTAAQVKERAERPTKQQNVYVKSTYTNNQGQRVAIMSDGSEKTLGSTLEVNNRIATLIANQEKANVQFRKLPEEDKKKWATERLALGEVTPAPAPAPAQVARPTTQAEFDALPKGTRYINPADGKEYAKN